MAADFDKLITNAGPIWETQALRDAINDVEYRATFAVDALRVIASGGCVSRRIEPAEYARRMLIQLGAFDVR